MESRASRPEHTLDGHTNDGQRGRSGYHTRQGSRHTGTGDDDTKAAALSTGGKGLNLGRSAVSREGVHFKRHLHLFEQTRSLFHNGQVAGAAHDNAYEGFHCLNVYGLDIDYTKSIFSKSNKKHTPHR